LEKANERTLEKANERAFSCNVRFVKQQIVAFASGNVRLVVVHELPNTH
jgi:hypothetical protein